MGTYDDDTLPLQPPIRLPSRADLAAAVRATPLAALLLDPRHAPAAGETGAEPEAEADRPQAGSTAEADQARPEPDEPRSQEEPVPGIGAGALAGLRSGPAGPEAAEVLRDGPAEEVLRVWTDVRRHLFGRDQLVFLQVVRMFLGREPVGEVPAALSSLGLAREADDGSAGSYALTPLGRWTAREMIAEATGQDIPVMGSFAGRDAAALLHGLRSYREAERIEELTGWLAGRDRVKAAEEMGAALAEVSPLARAIGVELLALDLGDDGRRVLDRLLGVRKLGAVVAARMGRDEQRPSPEEIAWVFVDMAAALLEFGGETDEVIQSMTMGMEPDQQASTIALLALGDHPWTERVLHVIIDRHPDEQVAGAARKALRRLRSLASLRG
ncbi:hypothetical protein FHU36_003369 [Nonomuraea muscovyensis]|uniref:Uncharacterized protein n=1 Tax=Nonomuraea muscovyensis TaxID=1124761 RepID=A0A7X0C1I8_9ACTN|nr:hypothetical protein [Nonomuraea muscovyensis]MBB6346824.1 hypothetical protein [Nonomuraea muscovyensis]